MPESDAWSVRACSGQIDQFAPLPDAQEGARAYGALAFVANLNGGNDCTAKSWLYVVNLLTGSKFTGTEYVSSLISNTSSSSGVTALVTSGQRIVGAGQNADGLPWDRTITNGVPIVPAKNAWRELRR